MNRLHKKLDKIGNDPKETAKSVGLRYAAPTKKGFYRSQNATGFTYRDQDEIQIEDNETLARIKSLVIPPAWEHVWISPYPNGHLQVVGTDTKGRKQYRYHSEWNKIRNQSKFYRLRRFAQVLPKIRAQVSKDLNRKGLPYEKVIALVVKLIELTNIRIGNDAYKKLYGSFGITTLRDRHVTFKAEKVQFEFTGKKGIKHQIKLESRRLAKLVRRCKDIPGQDLFQYYDQDGQRHTIGSADVNNYIKNISGDDFTAKDFRCWAGSVNALHHFQQSQKPDNETQIKRTIVETLDAVAGKLGNTRTVCRKYYVHPTVISSFERGTIWKYKTGAKGIWAAGEKALVRLLESEKIAEVN